jgi:hypothetical protein
MPPSPSGRTSFTLAVTIIPASGFATSFLSTHSGAPEAIFLSLQECARVNFTATSLPAAISAYTAPSFGWPLTRRLIFPRHPLSRPRCEARCRAPCGAELCTCHGRRGLIRLSWAFVCERPFKRRFAVISWICIEGMVSAEVIAGAMQQP